MQTSKIYQPSSSFLFSIFILLLIFGTSCRKDSGDQCFDNRTDEPVDLYLDGFFELTIDEGDETCIFLEDGCYDWYVEGVVTGDFLEGTVCVELGNFSSTIVIED